VNKLVSTDADCGETIELQRANMLRTSRTPPLVFMGHGHDITKRRNAMEHELDTNEVIELGTVSVETKGLTAGRDDHQVGLIPFAGLDVE